VTEKLSRLVALANRPGTEAEGAAARAQAERLAAKHGLEIVELRDGTLMVVDEFHGDLLRRLLHIANGSPAAGELGS
jgi:hypothetical protein